MDFIHIDMHCMCMKIVGDYARTDRDHLDLKNLLPCLLKEPKVVIRMTNLMLLLITSNEPG